MKTPGSICFDQKGNLYAAVTTIKDRDQTDPDTATWWGHPSAEVALFVSQDQGNSFQIYGVSKTDSTTPNWLPNLEHATGKQPLACPSLIYTHGQRGKNNQEIMSNEVFWCDIPSLLQSETK